MIEMKSDAVILNGSPADVYNRLSKPAELESLIHSAMTKAQAEGKEVPAELNENLEKISFNEDSISFQGGPTGSLTFRLADHTENESVQYVGEGTPVAIIIDFSIVPEGMDNCMLTIGVQADVPYFLRPMVQKPLQKGLDTFADMMRQIPSWRR